MSAEKFEFFSNLPKELQIQIFIDAGVLKKTIHEVSLLEKKYPQVLDKTFWKHYLYNLFPYIRVNTLAPEDANEERQFWKKIIQEAGKTLLDSIKNAPLKQLFRAIFRNDVEKVKALLSDARFENKNLIEFVDHIRTNDFFLPELSPTSLAGFLDRREILALFFEKARSEHKKQHYYWACVFNQVNELELYQSHYRKLSYHDASFFKISCQQGHFDTVEWLINHGSDVNKENRLDGSTAIYMACQHGHIDIVRLLISNGADIHKAIYRTGVTPFYAACQQGHLDIARLLIIHGADPRHHIGNNEGLTPFYIACEQGHFDIVKLLIEHGADIHKAIHRSGATPFYTACEHGHLAIVKLLIGLGADVHQARTDNGKTPLDIAKKTGHSQIARLIKARSKLAGDLTEENLIKAFRMYSKEIALPQQACQAARFFHLPKGNHYADIVALAFKRLDNDTSLLQFLDVVKAIAQEKNVDLKEYKNDEFYSLITLSEILSEPPIKGIPAVQAISHGIAKK
ncbi:ankyrin repeat domain-containing protein [Legionella spiritensis]|uniref:ankyrin repeat domain-containing protein n=1 Tax=Legionella spiritensis TaxID=452 RepID=UPI000F70679A|nr:ankyrin repeat domain-containing protein [Legionella spiritensis]VEG92208.1 Ankyrin repeat protein [Legionella spiritensis]